MYDAKRVEIQDNGGRVCATAVLFRDQNNRGAMTLLVPVKDGPSLGVEVAEWYLLELVRLIATMLPEEHDRIRGMLRPVEEKRGGAGE